MVFHPFISQRPYFSSIPEPEEEGERVPPSQGAALLLQLAPGLQSCLRLLEIGQNLFRVLRVEREDALPVGLVPAKQHLGGGQKLRTKQHFTRIVGQVCITRFRRAAVAVRKSVVTQRYFECGGRAISSWGPLTLNQKDKQCESTSGINCEDTL